mgnify:CR=1 FL=1
MQSKILIVDDEAAVLRSLERLLCRAGYEVLVASSGAQALMTNITSSSYVSYDCSNLIGFEHLKGILPNSWIFKPIFISEFHREF